MEIGAISGVIESKFRPYTEVPKAIPNWFWQTARVTVLVVTLGFVTLLFLKPELGLSLFWKLLLPCLPIVFATAPGLWRQVCPMAFLNQLPRQFGFSMEKTLPLVFKNMSYIFAVSAFFTLVSLRHVNLNAVPMAFFALVVAVLILAFVGGVIFKGRSGWCGTFCPLSPLQKIYGHAPLVSIRNGYCEPCLGCQKNCYDFNPQAALFSDLDDPDPWYVGHRRFFVAGVPGLILGFFHSGDPAVIGLGTYYLELTVSVLLSMGVFLALTSLLRVSLYKVVAIFGMASLILFYWFAAPVMVGMMASLGVPLPAWSAGILQAIALVVSAIVLVSGFRNEQVYLRKTDATAGPRTGVNLAALRHGAALSQHSGISERRSGRTLPAGDGKSLLEALETADLKIDFGCRMGMCGADPIAVINGHENLSAPTEEELATLRRLGLEGRARMACVCRALKGPITIDMGLDPSEIKGPAEAPRHTDLGKVSGIGRIVIIGNGVAGITAAESIRNASPSCKIDVIARERRDFYNRMAVGRAIYGRSAMEGLYLMPPEWYDRKEINVWLNTLASRIDVDKKELHLGTGESLPYDKLIIAQGGAAYVPPIEGSVLPGCFVLREASDAMAIRSWGQDENCTAAVVVGGGVLGIEAADALRQFGLKVTIVHRASHLMDRQLDAEASAILRHFLEGLGIIVRTGVDLRRVNGVARVEGLDLGENGFLPAQLCIFCTGVKPNKELAEAAGLGVNKGVIVDRCMQTSNPDIFAVGDVAELPDAFSGLWTIGTKQAQIAGAAVFGQADHYEPPKSIVKLKIDGIDVLAFGPTSPEDKTRDQIIDSDTCENVYRKLIVQAGKITGAMIVGPPGTARDIIPIVQRDADITGALDEIREGNWAALQNLHQN